MTFHFGGHWFINGEHHFLGVDKSHYPRLDKNVGFWLVDDPLVQKPMLPAGSYVTSLGGGGGLYVAMHDVKMV